MDFTTAFLLMCAGLATGTVGSMLGVGGGMIVIPVLTSLYGFGFEQARATSLLAVIATACGTAAATGKERFVNPRLGVLLAIPAVGVALLNAVLSSKVHVAFLYGLFAVVLTLTSVLMWRRERAAAVLEAAEPEGDGEEPEPDDSAGLLDGAFRDPKTDERVIYRVKRFPTVFAVSGAAGAMSGLLGVGGGIFQVPAMNVVAGVPIRAATATSNFLMGFTAASTMPIYFGRGHVQPLQTAAVVLGALVGSFLGSAIAKRLHGAALRRVFSFLLFGLALQMVRKAFE